MLTHSMMAVTLTLHLVLCHYSPFGLGLASWREYTVLQRTVTLSEAFSLPTAVFSIIRRSSYHFSGGLMDKVAAVSRCKALESLTGSRNADAWMQ